MIPEGYHYQRTSTTAALCGVCEQVSMCQLWDIDMRRYICPHCIRDVFSAETVLLDADIRRPERHERSAFHWHPIHRISQLPTNRENQNRRRNER